MLPLSGPLPIYIGFLHTLQLKDSYVTKYAQKSTNLFFFFEIGHTPFPNAIFSVNLAFAWSKWPPNDLTISIYNDKTLFSVQKWP